MKNIKIIIFGGVCLLFMLKLVVDLSYNQINLKILKAENEATKKIEYKNWNNSTEIEVALKRIGIGENAKPANIEDYRKELYDKYGFDALLSDYISVHRAIPDERDKACRNLTYATYLPKAAAIIIIYNERLSVLQRTIHSILDRTPPELLEEIILVDDGSTWPDMHEPLDNYLRYILPLQSNKVKLIRHQKRFGIMKARMSGARMAATKSKVLIFLDSHFEIGYNWLPPLLEPIAFEPKTCTCPIIDIIAFDTFEYRTNTPWRGYFDFKFNYEMRPLYADEAKKPAENFENYIMMGGAMAIGKEFFWQIGGFDEGMSQWGGEQFEISFKIWMCGGRLIDVPCSRLGHLFRDPNTKGNELLYGDYGFINRNYRRITDVWVDEVNRKNFLLNRPGLKAADPGNLSTRRVIRDRLNCKSFSWMLKNIMPDVLEIFPPIVPNDLASGFLRSLFDKNLCMVLSDKHIKLIPCPDQVGAVDKNRLWRYTWRGELRISDSICLESDTQARKVNSYPCHLQWGIQKWYYDRKTQWIIQEEAKLCLLAVIEKKDIQLAACNKKNLKLKWNFSHMDLEAMDKWDNNLRSKRPTSREFHIKALKDKYL